MATQQIHMKFKSTSPFGISVWTNSSSITCTPQMIIFASSPPTLPTEDVFFLLVPRKTECYTCSEYVRLTSDWFLQGDFFNSAIPSIVSLLFPKRLALDRTAIFTLPATPKNSPSSIGEVSEETFSTSLRASTSGDSGIYAAYGMSARHSAFYNSFFSIATEIIKFSRGSAIK
jgi:hypothetical protein